MISSCKFVCLIAAMENYCCPNPTPFPPPNTQPSLTLLNKTVGSSSAYTCALGFWPNDTLGEPTYTCNPHDNGTVTVTSTAASTATSTAVINGSTIASVNHGINYWTFKGKCECMSRVFAFVRSDSIFSSLYADVPGYCNDTVIFPPHTSDAVINRLVGSYTNFNCSLGFKPNATNGAPYIQCIPNMVLYGMWSSYSGWCDCKSRVHNTVYFSKI